MLRYITRRTLMMIPVLIIISMIVFWIIQLPPGDYVSTYARQLAEEGDQLSAADREALRQRFGLDLPIYQQYLNWIWGIVSRGDFGYSFAYARPVIDVVEQYMVMTIIVSVASFLFTYFVAIPIGVYSAIKQYSVGDYVFTTIGFLGMATPNFLLAIILMYFSFTWFGDPMLGLQSAEYRGADWSVGRVLDLLKHLIIPIVVIGTASTCELIRVMRGQMLDEMNKPNVITARAKGVKESRVIRKYPLRAALNPIVSTIGWSLTAIFTGSTITAIVLNLPTQGPVMLDAMLGQDMYLAGTWLLFMAVLTVIGTLISDILLGWLDPRIRDERTRS
ncbi:ABC transporter permease [Bogoriella caseilytica]|uniref:Peptide/nickel transport system permease protein n=1 Tax=Bogoriella caseilytica TaxID=56055 RepID=A0A3N2BD15_9MICO|nr:ABC transporter permease [Bogoriella caseilytica]ROR73141.1 peptide/nickel transport system permease protein [Bogoriella caseilytica]